MKGSSKGIEIGDMAKITGSWTMTDTGDVDGFEIHTDAGTKQALPISG